VADSKTQSLIARRILGLNWLKKPAPGRTVRSLRYFGSNSSAQNNGWKLSLFVHEKTAIHKSDTETQISIFSHDRAVHRVFTFSPQRAAVRCSRGRLKDLFHLY
jgi:hypothetical protein